MRRALSLSDFRPRPGLPAAAMPGAARLAQGLGAALQEGLGAAAAGHWRVALEAIRDDCPAPAEGETQQLSLQSEAGPLGLLLALDRVVVSALMEAAMGGTGAEPPFAMAERPLSRIEQGMLRRAWDCLSGALAETLGRGLARAFALTPESTGGGDHDLPLSAFHYVVNLNGYSGEIRLIFAREQLARQLEGSPGQGTGLQAEAEKKKLQDKIARSHAVLSVVLGPEMLTVEDIAALKPGRLLALASTVSSPVRMLGGGVAAFEGELARAGDRLAFRVTGILP